MLTRQIVLPEELEKQIFPLPFHIFISHWLARNTSNGGFKFEVQPVLGQQTIAQPRLMLATNQERAQWIQT